MRPYASPASPSSTGLEVLDGLDVAVGTKAVLPVAVSDRGPIRLSVRRTASRESMPAGLIADFLISSS